MLFAIGPTFTIGDLPLRLGNPGSATEEIQIKERNYFIRCCYDRIYVCKLVQFYITFRYEYKLKAKVTIYTCAEISYVLIHTLNHWITYTCILCFNLSQEGLVYAVEFSHRSGRDLINVAKKRTNIIPIIEDARHPHKYRMLVGKKSILKVQYPPTPRRQTPK